MTRKSSQYIQEGGTTDPNLLTGDLPQGEKEHAYLTLSQQYELILIKDYIRVQQNTQQNLTLGCDTSGK